MEIFLYCVQLATYSTVCCTMGTLVADSAGNIYGFHFSQNYNIMYLPAGSSNGATLSTLINFPNQTPYYNGFILQTSVSNQALLFFFYTNVASSAPISYTPPGSSSTVGANFIVPGSSYLNPLHGQIILHRSLSLIIRIRCYIK